VTATNDARPSLYEVAGGQPAMLALAAAHHERCLADPELNHPFSHDDLDPNHVAHLADYWGEVLGGPPRYSERLGSQTSLLTMHAGNGDLTDLGQRFVDCFVGAIDDAGLPADAGLRTALREYMEWAVADMIAYPDAGSDVPAGLPVPRWSWEGLVGGQTGTR
jgi:hemoglobin